MLAVIGVSALWIFYGWLLCAIIASYLSGRKGYGEKVGLASGMIGTVLGVVVWLLMPARDGSDWKVIGPFGRQRVDPDLALEKPAGPAGPAGPDKPDEVSTGR